VPKLVEVLVGERVIGAATDLFHTAVWTAAGELHSGKLGHGGSGDEHVLRLVKALAGKTVIGAAAGNYHTAVWTESGELFTFGKGKYGMLGHSVLVPQMIEALAGKTVVGVAAGG